MPHLGSGGFHGFVDSQTDRDSEFNPYVRLEIGLDIPKLIGSHAMGSLTAEYLKHLQNAPKDKFGVTHRDILYNKKEDNESTVR